MSTHLLDVWDMPLEESYHSWCRYSIRPSTGIHYLYSQSFLYSIPVMPCHPGSQSFLLPSWCIFQQFCLLGISISSLLSPHQYSDITFLLCTGFSFPPLTKLLIIPSFEPLSAYSIERTVILSPILMAVTMS